MKTKKLISNLKKEIEEIEKLETITQTKMAEYNFKIAQLLFAEKLMKAIKGDIKEFIKRDMEESKKAIIEAKKEAINKDFWDDFQTGAEAFVYRLEFELNKILDEAIK
ncbi:MAG: hypothetical protein ACTSR3_05835 [Candidatus Helarchaeota archaeon]